MRRWHVVASLAAALLVTGCAEENFREGLEAYQAKRYEQAVAIWRPLAQDGGPRAQHHLANLYRGGLGVERDLARSAEWMRRAARQGHAPSQFTLAYMLDEGMGVERDPAAAFKWYRLAAVGLHRITKRQEARQRAEELAEEIGPEEAKRVHAAVERWSPLE